MKTLFYILTTLFCLSCSMQNKLEEITIRLDKETLNPVRNPGERGTLHVTGRYSNGKTTDLPLSMTCSTPDRVADAPLDAALPPAVCAAVPEWAAA